MHKGNRLALAQVHVVPLCQVFSIFNAELASFYLMINPLLGIILKLKKLINTRFKGFRNLSIPSGERGSDDL
ncbi:hypothetical protein CSW08_07880 [Confluentibacter flavum]|uniref:Uncharacterized protein n=1 Tax=Confluentibacter flavum TaxID=1909700 RepID=A0A2N3HKK4_9FLAO|nr:hypothetical protein CSW08_07880 [Confluentibacter flavum]